MDLITTDGPGGELIKPPSETLEEMHENLLLGIKTLVRQASGLRDDKEYELLYGKSERMLRMVVDHVIILAIKRGESKQDPHSG